MIPHFYIVISFIRNGVTNEKRLEIDTMQKEKVLYIYSGKYFESNILDWYETFKSTLSEEENISRDKIK